MTLINLSLTINDRGEQVAELHKKLRKLGYTIPEHELDVQLFGIGTQDALRRFQKKHKLRRSGILDERTQAALTRAVAVVESGKNRIEGRIYLDDGGVAKGLKLAFYSRGFGGAETKVGEAATDAQGFYALSYDPEANVRNIEVRCLEAGDKELALSATRHDLDRHEIVNLVAPGKLKTQAPEYERLTAALSKQIGSLNKLGEARENADRQDLTLLHKATGWDARLIALAATAVKLSAESKLPVDFLYALFRMGMPTDKHLLCLATDLVLDKALAKAIEAGIVDIDLKGIFSAKKLFKRFAETTRREIRTPGAQSTFGDLLAKSGVSGAEKKTFEALYFSHQGTAAELWKCAEEQGISSQSILKMRLRGKLAVLTYNNVDLLESLEEEIGSPDKLDRLVDLDLFKSETWKERIIAIVGEDEEALAKIIPPAYFGEKTEERLERYAADLARKVRLNFPTQVIRRLVEREELPLGDADAAIKQSVGTFLKNATDLGFRLGSVPVRTFIARHGDQLFQDIDPEHTEATIQHVRRLHRLYQITPSDESLKVLDELGFSSADEVVQLSVEEFCDHFGRRFLTPKEAELTWRKAQQVNAVTFNWVTTALQTKNAPSPYAISGTDVQRAEAQSHLRDQLRDYPSMESLFGSLDYCECEHCRSVLSPAAYLVDLFQFLDPDAKQWELKCDIWSDRHDGDAYPYPRPFEVLMGGRPDLDLPFRRPDLPHLPLTCENTHTELPYIDVVNEILEYSVVYGELPEASHDTGEATTEELLAEPHNILPPAYDILRNPSQACHPLTLPFDLWLETVRGFLDHFKTPFWKVLEVFRRNEALFSTDHWPHSGSEYFRATVFLEYLGISSDEYDVFTRERPVDWCRLYGPVDGDLREALKSARTLARQLDVGYKQLVDIVQTGFVNPEIEHLALLWKYGFGPSDALWYLENRDDSEHAEEIQAFEQRIRGRFAETLSESEVEERLNNILTYIEGQRTEGRFEGALVLRDASGLCNFDETYLEYAAPLESTPSKLVFIKINLFVRLWKKLGWTIEETDRALRVFLPGGSEWITEATIEEAFRTVLVCLAHLKALDDKVDAGRDSRLKLLTLWADLPTTGRNPLYARLFLTPNVKKIDPVFDDPMGKYLCYFNELSGEYEPFDWDPELEEDWASGNVAINNHLFGIQAALQLTADETGQILADAGSDIETVALNLANCSLLYRYRLLADSLKLSIRDLIALKAMSGLDPFRALSPVPLEEVEDDFLLTQTLGFVEIVQTVKDSGFRIEDLDYLLAHHLLDPEGKYRDDPAALLTLLKTLAGGLHRIREEHAVPPDPAAFSDDQLRQKLSLVLPPEVAETFFAMWAGTVEYQAVQTDVPPEHQLNPERFADEAAIRVNYDPVLEEQRLIYRGVLLHDERVELDVGLSWVAGDSFWSTRFGRLLDSVQEDARRFFADHLLKTPLGNRHSFGFLEKEDFGLLFSPSRDDGDKRARLAQTFLPYLQQQLARLLIVQTLAANLSAEPALIEALLTDTRLLSDPSQPDDQQPLLNAFESAGDQGVNVTYTTTDPATEYTSWLSTADTEIYDPDTSERRLLDNARFEGYLEVPTTGAYRFFVACAQADVRAELSFAHLSDTFLQGVTSEDEEGHFELKSQVIELKAGIPYRYICSVSNLDGSTMELLVQGETLARGALSRLTLYPQAAVERLTRARVLLTKVWQIIQGFSLGEREVRYLLTHPEDFNDLDLRGLPTREADASAAEATALFSQFLRLADYARLREDLAAGEDLIDLFERARRTYVETIDLTVTEQIEMMDEKLCQILADITRRELATVQEAAAHLGFGTIPIPDTVNPELLVAEPFATERGIRRLWEILQIVERLGVAIRDVARWATPMPDARTARDLKQTVKACYEQENWLRIAKPVYDTLRRKQRDALVAFIMYRDEFESVERLYEFFLVDPGMEPVVQTSRIQLAISSVQQFIQRCLLNLEPKVAPSMIDAKQWQWMKRYRVWEANRKIFLFPENWLEPEWRDDKTHLFQELESALLQGDVSRELVEDAFHTYLKGLETIARLDIVTMYREEDPDELELYTLHVIGRTYNPPHKYFYRRFSSGMWTPWEPVTAELDGDHIVAVVWQQRLHLFWATFLEKNEEIPEDERDEPHTESVAFGTMDDMVDDASRYTRKVVEVNLNWCEYFQGQWTARELGGFADAIHEPIPADFNKSQVFIHVSKDYADDGAEFALNIHLEFDRGNRAFKLLGKCSPPHSCRGMLSSEPPYSYDSKQVTEHLGSGALCVSFADSVIVEYRDGEPYLSRIPDITPKTILGDSIDAFSLLLERNSSGLANPLEEAFFYQNDHHTFFVEPAFTETLLDPSDVWAVAPLTPNPQAKLDSWWDDFPVYAEADRGPPPSSEASELDAIDPEVLYRIRPRPDWVTDANTVLKFDDCLIGATGRSETSAPIDRLRIIGGEGLNSAFRTTVRDRNPSHSPR